ncbi:DNA-binding transcriptional regulator AsnC [Pseudodesulfovibrio hydrargyri]|uniref:siroheme decarboxylase n=1 Tax=Pseudodesulfovibrio hydrargyri TaxID=2125990 RepID=A0A1J5MZ64_9BACT|nr:AsnC family transcriptional regulator [Pseudodesulfovibrio hydrargyri]OIQ51282.1 DNA-binding transcriptional regulator AsnC [Pseudodesulfovibrio hydrargyri]
MDAYDKQILDIIQSHFPLASRPYEEVGKQVGLTEAEVLERVRAMKASGLIRRMGANFSSQSLGWQSTLCAASVPEDRLDAFVAEVNRHDGVTHNYLRENEFNVWFALIAPDMDAVEEILASITEATGIKVLNLPADKLFKIKVDFKMDK